MKLTMATPERCDGLIPIATDKIHIAARPQYYIQPNKDNDINC